MVPAAATSRARRAAASVASTSMSSITIGTRWRAAAK
jgi:hypothetical protein